MRRKRHQGKFIAAKVNIHENIFSENVEDLIRLIPHAILKKPEILQGDYRWKITETSEINEDGRTFIYGDLVRSQFESVEVLEGDNLIDYPIPDRAYTSRFVYEPISEVLIFEETSKIRRDDFTKIFEKLIQQSDIQIGEVVISYINKTEDLVKKILALDVLTKIEFEFIHPNFHKKETFRSLADILTEENAKKMKLNLENEKGLNKDGQTINQGLEMISLYGEAKATGYNELPSRSQKHTRKKKQPKLIRIDSRESVHTENMSEKSEGELKQKLRGFLLRVAQKLN
ncbi:hypothetical protein CN543_28845 [Bacillus toyonensis]|uniref:hypothetical protein n=1 Tax=Bacillus toyonensis TaxID=155322 RepID=UPI000BF1BC92|nr:hypothetical protein [Bacillus toyonensis]MCG3793631.1 hypothetical protein [Bacillus toyonensis]PEN31279.1 hypothetical protein CN543_28845 [Bacillus toyonensis]QWH46391.1 hypothetical protein EXW64_19165 [Bacillus toyonensis]QWH90254.1 hypothetical protein EXW29_19470 [Bacillus toyonensis]QWI33406.1 hypothetical protein EXW25_19460 [Bacillus toyonensis]